MLLPPPQSNQSTDVREHSVRIIVAGSRKYNDKKEFHECLVDYLTRFDKSVLFISGAASTGADNLIIQWCKKFKYPCLEMPADWDNIERQDAVVRINSQGKEYNCLAGHQRNAEMLELATNLLCFYDGRSPGTRNMIEISRIANIPTRVIIIKKEGNE